jgi:hypothetical protein
MDGKDNATPMGHDSMHRFEWAWKSRSEQEATKKHQCESKGSQKGYCVDTPMASKSQFWCRDAENLQLRIRM